MIPKANHRNKVKSKLVILGPEEVVVPQTIGDHVLLRLTKTLISGAPNPKSDGDMCYLESNHGGCQIHDVARAIILV